MEQGSTLESWSSRGGWRRKKEDNIKEKEYIENGDGEIKRKNTVTTGIRLVIKF